MQTRHSRAAAPAKRLLGLALLALVLVGGYDGLRVGLARLSAADEAGGAAQAGVDACKRRDVQASYRAATAFADSNGGGAIRPEEFQCTQETGVVALHLHRGVPTLLVQHVGPLAHLDAVDAAASGSPGS